LNFQAIGQENLGQLETSESSKAARDKNLIEQLVSKLELLDLRLTPKLQSPLMPKKHWQNLNFQV
jgi:hypothetical protein